MIVCDYCHETIEPPETPDGTPGYPDYRAVGNMHFHPECQIAATNQLREVKGDRPPPFEPVTPTTETTVTTP